MAYTLADFARLAENPLKAGVIDILRESSPILDKLSFSDEGTLDIELLRTKSLPTVYSRKIGESFTESKGQVEPIVDRIINFGGYIDMDKALIKSRTKVDQKALQISMFTKAMGSFFNNAFFNGSPSSDYDSLTGIWYRLVNYLPAAQSIDAGDIDISTDSTTIAAAKIQLIDFLHALCDVTGRGAGGPDVLFMGRTVKLRLESMLRQSGLLGTTADSFGRKFATFGEGGPAIMEAGVTDPLDLTSQVLTSVELSDGSALTGGACSSIFAVKFGGEFLNGFQTYPLDVNDVGMLESGVAYRVTIDWTPGIYMVSPFSVGRLYGLVAA